MPAADGDLGYGFAEGEETTMVIVGGDEAPEPPHLLRVGEFVFIF